MYRVMQKLSHCSPLSVNKVTVCVCVCVCACVCVCVCACVRVCVDGRKSKYTEEEAV